MQEVAAPDAVPQVCPPLAVTVYPTMGEPPDAGADHDTVDWPSAFDVADTPEGAPGIVAGVARLEAAEAAEVPAALVALTVNV